jgi:hypothetical protein
VGTEISCKPKCNEEILTVEAETSSHGGAIEKRPEKKVTPAARAAARRWLAPCLGRWGLQGQTVSERTREARRRGWYGSRRAERYARYGPWAGDDDYNGPDSIDAFVGICLPCAVPVPPGAQLRLSGITRARAAVCAHAWCGRMPLPCHTPDRSGLFVRAVPLFPARRCCCCCGVAACGVTTLRTKKSQHSIALREADW